MMCRNHKLVDHLDNARRGDGSIVGRINRAKSTVKMRVTEDSILHVQLGKAEVEELVQWCKDANCFAVRDRDLHERILGMPIVRSIEPGIRILIYIRALELEEPVLFVDEGAHEYL